MRNTFLYLTILSVVILFSCNNSNPTNNDQKKTLSKLEEKLAPNEHFNHIRFGGDIETNFPAYEKAAKDLQNSLNQKKVTPFNEEWTLQGPSNIGARINTIATDNNNADIIYVGYASGGVWKTVNGGIDWSPIFDDVINTAIGKITIDPMDSNIIYVGTGDPNLPGILQLGRGLFKSDNGGATWNYIGLEETYIITDIVINPKNNQEIVVSTMGLPFKPTQERGIYRSEDGGVSWEQKLFVQENAGISDLHFHKDRPEYILAAGWNRYLQQFSSVVSGEYNDLWFSDDFGETWTLKELDKDDINGRMGVTYSESDPDKAYCMVVNDDRTNFDIFQSEDGGISWVKMEASQDNRPRMLGGFGWYFGKIRALNFNGEEKIQILGVDMYEYDITLNSWDIIVPEWYYYDVHADKHDMVRDADGNVLLATDGGLYKAEFAWEWEDIESIPTTQFYKTEYNVHEPDLYYGGAQDNGTSVGNKDNLNEWERIYGGDGFQMRFNPENSNEMYVSYQYGNIAMIDSEYERLGFFNSFLDDYRANWDTPYLIDLNDPSSLIVGYDKVYKGGLDPITETFTPREASPDLTDGPIYSDSYHNISTLDQSTLDFDLLYAGTADGNIWRGENEAWTKISEDLPKLYITSVKASPSNIDRVFTSISGYRLFDQSPSIYMSDDRGENWENIQGDLPDAVIYDIFIYPDKSDSIIVVGTDFGVYATLNQGVNWERLGVNMPIIPVLDFAHNLEYNELIAATFARGIQTYPLDSLIATDIVSSVTANKPTFDFEVYPNPIVNNLSLKGITGNITYEIFTANGQVVVYNKGNANEKIDVSSLHSGNYYIRVIKEDKSYATRQFIKG